MESDSKFCINAIKAPKNKIPRRLSNFVDEILLITEHFEPISFNWISRVGNMVAQKKEKRNMVAHLLAKWSLNSGGVNFSDVTSAAHVLLMFFFLVKCFVNVIHGDYFVLIKKFSS